MPEEYVDLEFPDLRAIDARFTSAGSPFELVEQPSPGGSGRRFRAGPHSLTQLFEGLARFGDRPFLLVGGERLSYAEFLAQARTASAALRRRGLGPASRLALGLPNGLDWLICFAGASLCGASIVAPAPGMIEAGGLAGAGCALEVTDLREWRSWMAAAEGETAPAACPKPEDEALIVFTSGTSGPAKPVRLDHGGLLAGLRNMMLGNALAAQRRPRSPVSAPARPAPPSVLVMTPFHYIGGYSQFLLMALLGGRLIAPVDWNPGSVLETLHTEDVRSLHGLTPSMVQDLLDLKPEPGRCACVSTVNFHGAPPSAAILEKLKAVFPQLEMGSGYGLTETNGSVAVASEYDLRLRPGAAGRVGPATEVRIVGPDGEALAGEVGEIWLAGPMLARGYGFDSAPHPDFHDGWFRTGDFGRLDSDRFLYLEERAGETIEAGDRKVSCLTLEHAALSLPGVRDAAAFALPDPRLGQKPCLAVSPASAQDGESLRVAVARAARIPVDDVFLSPAICRTPSGKVDRRVLARQALTAQA